MKKEFHAAFALSRMDIFEVSYYTLGSNKHPYFTTSAARFVRNKRDWQQCGQAQDTICKAYPKAKAFYKKWDDKHLQDLTEQEHIELMADLEALKAEYPAHIVQDNDIPFSKLKDLSMTVKS